MSMMRSLRWHGSSAKMRPRKIPLDLVLLVMTAAALCRGEGSIGSISLSMDGLVTVRNRSVAALVCTVVHNSSQVSTFFYINGTKLTTSNALQMDGSLRVEYYDHCYQPPSQGQCEELSLLIRVNPLLNNTRISCRTRARGDSIDTSLHTSPEEVTIIVGNPEVPETPSCTSPTSAVPSSTISLLPSSATTPTPEPSPDIPSINMSENKSPSVLPEGKERIYVFALGSVSVLFICSLFGIIFLLVLLCRKRRRKVEFDLAPVRSVSPEATEERQLDEKRPSYRPTSSISAEERSQGGEPRYVSCSTV